MADFLVKFSKIPKKFEGKVETKFMCLNSFLLVFFVEFGEFFKFGFVSVQFQQSKSLWILMKFVYNICVVGARLYMKRPVVKVFNRGKYGRKIFCIGSAVHKRNEVLQRTFCVTPVCFHELRQFGQQGQQGLTVLFV